MTKRNKIIYWAATINLAVAFLPGAIVQLIRVEQTIITFDHLGYPLYFFTILSIWKILGVIAVLIPKFPLVKEWAYAGFIFVISGAIISHITMGDTVSVILPRLLTLLMVFLSWYFRPNERKISRVAL